LPTLRVRVLPVQNLRVERRLVRIPIPPVATTQRAGPAGNAGMPVVVARTRPGAAPATVGGGTSIAERDGVNLLPIAQI